MKTKLFTIVAVMFTALVATKNTFANEGNVKEDVTVLTNVSNISKLEIRGNVEVYVSDGAADQVKVYNKYYSESALVQSQNGVLRIASYKAQKLVVWVTAADLRSINVYDNAEVRSFGSLSKIDIDVNLYDNASANLKLDAYKASINVNDNAKAALTGNVNEYSLQYAQAANVNHTDFVAVNASEKQVAAKRGTELAGL